MIRVLLGAEVRPGIWLYSVPGTPLVGRSRQPLLDACRQLKRMGADPLDGAGLFRAGRSEPDITCSIEAGAAATVLETAIVRPRFGKFTPFDPSVR
jgi:hypothetical protein